MDIIELKTNLADAGCGTQAAEYILKAYADGKLDDSLRMMKRDRCRLMEELHESGRKVDCLDFLIRRTEKELKQDGA